MGLGGIFVSMATSADDLYQAALDLDEHDRAALIGRLLDSLDTGVEEGVEAAWLTEIERRVRELECGSVATIPWETVRSRLHRGEGV